MLLRKRRLTRKAMAIGLGLGLGTLGVAGCSSNDAQPTQPAPLVVAPVQQQAPAVQQEQKPQPVPNPVGEPAPEQHPAVPEESSAGVTSPQTQVIVEQPAQRDTVVVQQPAPRETVIVQQPAPRETVIVQQPAPRETVFVQESVRSDLPKAGTNCYWESYAYNHNPDGGYTNIRSSQSSKSDSNIIGRIPAGAGPFEYEICGQTGWVRVRYNDIFGWVHNTQPIW